MVSATKQSKLKVWQAKVQQTVTVWVQKGRAEFAKLNQKQKMLVSVLIAALLVALVLLVTILIVPTHHQKTATKKSALDSFYVASSTHHPVEPNVKMGAEVQANAKSGKAGATFAPTVDQSAELQKLQAINASIASLKAQMAEAKNTENTQKIASLMQMVQQLQTQVASIVSANQKAAKQQTQFMAKNTHAILDASQKITRIEKAVVKQKYLPASTLPFTVAGIDFWNGAPMATIMMGGVTGASHYRLMGVGNIFHCASKRCTWRVKTIDASNKTVVFQNGQQQLVRVSV